jgi:hypothetical protein
VSWRIDSGNSDPKCDREAYTSTPVNTDAWRVATP